MKSSTGEKFTATSALYNANEEEAAKNREIVSMACAATGNLAENLKVCKTTLKEFLRRNNENSWNNKNIGR